MQIAERLDRAVDEALRTFPVADALAVGDGLATERADLVHHIVRRMIVAAGAIDTGSEVVHDHLGAVIREAEGVFAANTPACTRDDCYTTFTESAHRYAS
ncbi:unannotated protein [freshwater metagenome]|uniref:Unannotated protein n=1 Tax=freshwater metagenome TaxID=449393 RepID=A0A6J7MX69_9ZZZZ